MKITRRDFIREGVLALLGLVTRDVPRPAEPVIPTRDSVFQFEMPLAQFSPVPATEFLVQFCPDEAGFIESSDRSTGNLVTRLHGRHKTGGARSFGLGDFEVVEVIHFSGEEGAGYRDFDWSPRDLRHWVNFSQEILTRNA